MGMVSKETYAQFVAGFAGEVLRQGEAGFAAARAAAIWNGDIRRQPALIVQPASEQAVALAIGFAREHGLELTVRGGGHSGAGHAVCDDGLMIDLSRMNAVRVDPQARRARCGGGATWAELDAATAAHGLAVTGGSVSHTGVAGLTLGGGMGWLSRRLGLSCDNLVSATVVTADSRIVTASAEENPDLFWGLRGGGGNFGVVTEFEFQLHEVAPMANLGFFFWRAADAREPLRFARDFVHTLPNEMGAILLGISAPPAPFVPAEYQGETGFAVAVASWGSADEHAQAVAPLRAYRPLFETVTPIPYVALQQMIDHSVPWGIHVYDKELHFDTLTDEMIEIMIDRLPHRASQLTHIASFALGGAFGQVPEDATAFGGSRATRWAIFFAACTLEPQQLAADRAWLREFWDALRPYASGTYVNVLGDRDVGEDRVRACYGAAKYDRLAALKLVWDPQNLFRHNVNIRAATLSRM